MWLIILIFAYLLLWNESTSILAANENLSAAFEELILANGWAAWSIFPYVAANIGFWFTAIVCDVYSTTFSSTSSHVVYCNKSRSSRKKEGNVTIASELGNAFLTTVIGQGLNVTIGKSFFQSLGTAPVTMLPDFRTFLVQFALMVTLFDFALYCQHRASHTDIMWRFHQTHHANSTPIGLSAATLSVVEEIESAACVYLSALIVQPHPVTYACSIAGILSDLVIVHTGLDCQWLKILSLRFLPGRAEVHMHDHHHMYSDGKGGKNFGSSFWIWDYMFGTLARTSRT